jgi:chaperonin cofactor prefoldin
MQAAPAPPQQIDIPNEAMADLKRAQQLRAQSQNLAAQITQLRGEVAEVCLGTNR